MTYLRRKWDAAQLNDVSVLHSEILKSIAHRKIKSPQLTTTNIWPPSEKKKPAHHKKGQW